MNNARRIKIKKIIKDIETIKNDLQDILSDEEFAFDSMPENLQYSSRGEESQEAIDYMNEAMDGLDNAVEQLESIN
jgi:hypothetical protein